MHARNEFFMTQTISVGAALPSMKLITATADGPKEVTTEELFAGKKVVVFAVPGAGRMMIDSIYGRDYPVVQGMTLALAVVTVAGVLEALLCVRPALHEAPICACTVEPAGTPSR